jgi:chemotaxis methyl-accepting protein methylase
MGFEEGLFGKSPVRAYLRLNRRLWSRLPASLIASAPVRRYGALVHRLTAARARRSQLFGTFFFRNRPQLALMRRLADRKAHGSTLRLAFLGCSNGAELYSVLYTIRAARPDLTVISQAVDISPEVLAQAQKGVYSRTSSEFVGQRIFARIGASEVAAMFDAGRDAGELRIKPWLKERVAWRLADATSPRLLEMLGPQDMVVANNFLCHMDPPQAEQCLRNIARLVNPGGHLIVSGVDLDLRTRVARDLGWTPVRESIEEIHDGDPSVRNDWPCDYWGLEPFDHNRRDRDLRYASAFQVSGPPQR